MTLLPLPKRPAAGLPPDEHKAVRWEGGDRRKTSKDREKNNELANFGFPNEDKVDVANPLQQVVLIR